MPNTDIHTDTHVCLQTCMHTYIQVKHFSLETYVILDCKYLQNFQIYMFPEFVYIWKC